MLCRCCNTALAHPVYGDWCEDCYAEGVEWRLGWIATPLSLRAKEKTADKTFYSPSGLVDGPITRRGSDLYAKDYGESDGS